MSEEEYPEEYDYTEEELIEQEVPGLIAQENEQWAFRRAIACDYCTKPFSLNLSRYYRHYDGCPALDEVKERFAWYPTGRKAFLTLVQATTQQRITEE